jgi:hopanoid-associated phosphorylase
MARAGKLSVVVVTGMAFEARIAAAPGVVTVCGIADTINAALADAIARGCRGIVSFGIAGGLSPDLVPGACIVGREIVTANERFAVHARWSTQLLRTIPGAIEGDIVGVQAPIATRQEKRELARATGAIAADMESGVAAIAAARHGLPFTAVRIVADPCERTLPPAALIALRADGTPNLPAVLRSLLFQPSQLGALIRVGRDTAVARAALTKARRRIGAGFGLDDVASA